MGCGPGGIAGVAGALRGVAGGAPPPRAADGRVEIADVDPLGQFRARGQRRTPVGTVIACASCALSAVAGRAPVLPLRPVTTVRAVAGRLAVLPRRTV